MSKRISDVHEAWLCKVLVGRRMRGSGNQFSGQMDGRHDRYSAPFAFAWDGKATESKSVGVSRAMLAKAVEQAGAERPLIALRYVTAGERPEDWFVVRADDFIELREAAIESAERAAVEWVEQ